MANPVQPPASGAEPAPDTLSLKRAADGTEPKPKRQVKPGKYYADEEFKQRDVLLLLVQAEEDDNSITYIIPRDELTASEAEFVDNHKFGLHYAPYYEALVLKYPGAESLFSRTGLMDEDWGSSRTGMPDIHDPDYPLAKYLVVSPSPMSCVLYINKFKSIKIVKVSSVE